MSDGMTIEVWLYGPISRYGNEADEAIIRDRTVTPSHAELHLELNRGSTIQDLLEHLKLPPEEKGITFINGKLAALPGVDADHDVELHDGDRVGISHRRSMWPFQYRFGARMEDKLQDTFRKREDRGIHHAYTEPNDE
ncbi:MAG: MoaD/ThiS family protein [Chloroflexota bacterium]|nr:MoaD/ThiS family protein [Chloroflexota bacterium]